jgi:hypothetical protein
MSIRPIIDAGPSLNFLSSNKERLLIAVLGPLSAPETVRDEVLRKSRQDDRFRAAANQRTSDMSRTRSPASGAAHSSTSRPPPLLEGALPGDAPRVAELAEVRALGRGLQGLEVRGPHQFRFHQAEHAQPPQVHLAALGLAEA